MSNAEKMYFITSSGIKNIVGKDLITDRFVAIFELVKNAYDARANQVVVSFNSSMTSPSITIRDNGIGMSKDDLESKWLHLAFSEKIEGQSNEDRAFVGAKGVGRFSCDSLGSILTITTKKVNSPEEHILKVNWQDFEQSLQIRFEDISVQYSSRKVRDEEVSSSYTELSITGLRHIWDEKSVQKAIESLRRLKNPFVLRDGFDVYCGFDLISMFNSSGWLDFQEDKLVKSNISEVLKDKSITIEVKISDRIEVNLSDRGSRIYSLEKENDTILVGVDVFIALNYLTTSAKSTFTRRMGIEPVRYGNIFVYKNNFRVSPYGDVDYNLFGVNTRKAQGYNRYLGTREIIGHIDIKDVRGYFKETSSRNNGFIENVYLETLKEVYLDFAHKPLERYINLIKWGEDNESGEEISLATIEQDKAEVFSKSLTNKVYGNFKVKYFSKNFIVEEKRPEILLEKIASTLPEKQKEQVKAVIKNVVKLKKENVVKEQELSIKQEAIENLQRQNKNLSTKRPESSYGEQLGHHLPAMADRLYSGVEDLNLLTSIIPDEKKIIFLEALRKIRRTELELRAFKNLLLKTEVDLRSPQIINWFDLAAWFKSDKDQNSHNKFKVICVLADPSYLDHWLVRSNALEVIMMYENMCQNAKEHGASFIEFLFDKDSLRISSDSYEINQSDLAKVFELGYSSKPNGTGIGLNQVFNFLGRVKLEIEVNNNNGLVVFTISK